MKASRVIILKQSKNFRFLRCSEEAQDHSRYSHHHLWEKARSNVSRLFTSKSCSHRRGRQGGVAANGKNQTLWLIVYNAATFSDRPSIWFPTVVEQFYLTSVGSHWELLSHSYEDNLPFRHWYSSDWNIQRCYFLRSAWEWFLTLIERFGGNTYAPHYGINIWMQTFLATL